MPGGYVCSGSMKRALEKTNVRDVVTGKQPVRKLFSKEKRSLQRRTHPLASSWTNLSILGPIFVLKLKFAPKGYARKLVAEASGFTRTTR